MREVQPDLSLIKNYVPEDSTNYRPVACNHFTNGKKHLYYINVHHVTGTDNSTCKTIERAIEGYEPQLVIIEGLSTQAGISPPSFAEYAKRQKAENFNQGEPGYLAYLAIQNNIPFIGGEPTTAEILESMAGKGYSTEDVLGFYMLRHIPIMRREDKIIDDADCAEYFKKNIPPEERLSFSEFKTWYNAHKSENKNFLDIDNNDLAPFAVSDATYFQTLHAAISRVREEHLDTLIATSFANHDKILAVYGDGHLIVSRSVFEKMLGKGETVLLAAPDSHHHGYQP